MLHSFGDVQHHLDQARTVDIPNRHGQDVLVLDLQLAQATGHQHQTEHMSGLIKKLHCLHALLGELEDGGVPPRHKRVPFHLHNLLSGTKAQHVEFGVGLLDRQHQVHQTVVKSHDRTITDAPHLGIVDLFVVEIALLKVPASSFLHHSNDLSQAVFGVLIEEVVDDS